MTKELFVKKVSVDSGVSVKMEYTETITVKNGEDTTSTTNDYTVTIRNRPHEDLVNAVKNLSAHVVQLCEMTDVPSLDDIPEKLLSSIEVSGLTIGGSGEHEGVVIIAKKRLKHNRVVNLITPFVKWEDEHCQYIYATDLSARVDVVIDEAKQYMNGKVAPNPQLEIQFKETAEA